MPALYSCRRLLTSSANFRRICSGDGSHPRGVRMRRTAAFLLILPPLLGARAARAEDLVALQKEYNKAVSQWRGPAFPHPAQQYLSRFRQVADENAGKREAIIAMQWMLSNNAT